MEILANIAYTQIGPLPLVAVGGMVTLALFLCAAVIGLLNGRGIRIVPFVWHARLAWIAIVSGLIHGFLALSAYFTN